METSGAITGYIDVAQLVLYGFWIFFFGLIMYLRREDKREGYPLEADVGPARSVQGFPGLARPKTWKLESGDVTNPTGGPEPQVGMTRTAPSAGSPYVPTGDGMGAGVGPGAYANRRDVPDLDYKGNVQIRPLRMLPEYSLESRDPDPRGMEVVGADGAAGGRIVDVWVDTSEMILRYYEFEKAGSGERALVPVNFTRIPSKSGPVKVGSIMGRHFAGVPGLASPDQVTLREEDRIVGYYGGGYLYADPARQEPLL